jgi:hypothetical protein
VRMKFLIFNLSVIAKCVSLYCLIYLLITQKQVHANAMHILQHPDYPRSKKTQQNGPKFEVLQARKGNIELGIVEKILPDGTSDAKKASRSIKTYYGLYKYEEDGYMLLLIPKDINKNHYFILLDK